MLKKDAKFFPKTHVEVKYKYIGERKISFN